MARKALIQAGKKALGELVKKSKKGAKKTSKPKKPKAPQTREEALKRRDAADKRDIAAAKKREAKAEAPPVNPAGTTDLVPVNPAGTTAVATSPGAAGAKTPIDRVRRLLKIGGGAAVGGGLIGGLLAVANQNAQQQQAEAPSPELVAQAGAQQANLTNQAQGIIDKTIDKKIAEGVKQNVPANSIIQGAFSTLGQALGGLSNFVANPIAFDAEGNRVPGSGTSFGGLFQLPGAEVLAQQQAFNAQPRIQAQIAGGNEAAERLARSQGFTTQEQINALNALNTGQNDTLEALSILRPELAGQLGSQEPEEITQLRTELIQGLLSKKQEKSSIKQKVDTSILRALNASQLKEIDEFIAQSGGTVDDENRARVAKKLQEANQLEV